MSTTPRSDSRSTTDQAPDARGPVRYPRANRQRSGGREPQAYDSSARRFRRHGNLHTPVMKSVYTSPSYVDTHLYVGSGIFLPSAAGEKAVPFFTSKDAVAFSFQCKLWYAASSLFASSLQLYQGVDNGAIKKIIGASLEGSLECDDS